MVFFISLSAVSAADGNFTSLQTEIENSADSIELTQNYVYDNASDSELINGITIAKSNFVVEGNGYTIDGSNQARIFNIEGDNITLKNLNLINGNAKAGGAIYADNLTTIYNSTLSGNTAEAGAAIFGTDLTIISSNFINNHGTYGVVFGKNDRFSICKYNRPKIFNDLYVRKR